MMQRTLRSLARRRTSLAGMVLAGLAFATPFSVMASPGCVLTFRHGGIVQADACQDMGDAVAYLRFGGWIVVRKAVLASVADATATTVFNPPWTAAEERARLAVLPREGGVPIGPTGVALPSAPPPQVVYVPVPTPPLAPPGYEESVVAYAYPLRFRVCPGCVPHHRRGHGHAIVSRGGRGR
jgi:hypothetical protein